MELEMVLQIAAGLMLFLEIVKDMFLKPARARFPQLERFYPFIVNGIAVAAGLYVAWLGDLDILGGWGVPVGGVFTWITSGLLLASGNKAINLVYDFIRKPEQQAQVVSKIVGAYRNPAAVDDGEVGDRMINTFDHLSNAELADINISLGHSVPPMASRDTLIDILRNGGLVG